MLSAVPFVHLTLCSIYLYKMFSDHYTMPLIVKCFNFFCLQNGDVCISILHPPVDDPQSGELPSERWNPTQNVRLALSLSHYLSSYVSLSCVPPSFVFSQPLKQPDSYSYHVTFFFSRLSLEVTLNSYLRFQHQMCYVNWFWPGLSLGLPFCMLVCCRPTRWVCIITQWALVNTVMSYIRLNAIKCIFF